jgi:flagellar protein FliO/FliZ
MNFLFEELGQPARVVVALVLVLALIALTVWLLRRFGEGRIATSGGGRNRQQRLSVLDSAVVDARRRLVLIRRDNVEHLLLIGGPTDVVVEPNIVRAQPLGGAARPAARPGGFEEEAEATLLPETEAEHPRPVSAPPQPARPTPRPLPQRIDPQYADMAQRLEAALRKPVPETEMPRTPPAPTPRAPEPRPIESRPAPALRPAPAVMQPTPAPRAPEPRVIEPRVVEPPRPAPEKPVQPAKQETAADIFGSLEEEMASLLRPGKKESK